VNRACLEFSDPEDFVLELMILTIVFLVVIARWFRG
jgi:hypothetical protein